MKRFVYSAHARDNCRCCFCVNTATMQRGFNISTLDRNLVVKRVTQDNFGFEVTWSDSHKSSYTWKWLQSAMSRRDGSMKVETEPARRLWNREAIQEHPPEVVFDQVMDSTNLAGIADLTQKIRTHGLCFVVQSPPTPEATQALLERIGPIRNTHYGGFYDFVPDMAKADTAYTNLALDLHTDTTYFTEPAGLQAFHLLSHTATDSNRAGSLGGTSILADGFYVADRLKRDCAEHFKTLSSYKLPWHASGNEDVAIAPDMAYPVIETHNGMVQRIRWNNDDRGEVPIDTDVDKWYDAAQAWNTLLSQPENQYEFLLTPGRILIFDNWRVLHGRKAFTGLRRICGGYINRDDFISRWKLSNQSREDVIAANLQLR
ncbi:hypothetical protein HIM_09872 [Hirsutella minnesotensis 3608]|uniref:trimethyllysine dioxygenase n=1 Tax=Hirsutella minnesotensis 3608 TaxID=1043627 RepID=A0A0F8A2V5_9HYPO|nr:hypothetical protein HIM_09872 [Hirsutella minnesotensis 3608]